MIHDTIDVTLPSKRLVLTIGVVVLAALAGCASSADTPDDSTSTVTEPDAPDNDTDSAVTEQPRDAGENDTDPIDDVDVDALVIENDNEAAGDTGSTDGQASENTSLQTRHAAVSEDAESITARFGAELSTEQGGVSFNSTAAVDLASQAVRQRTLYEGSTANGFLTTTFAEVDAYLTPTDSYKRTTSDFASEPTTSHERPNDSANVFDETNLTRHLQTGLVGNAEENVLWTRDGTATFDGTETARYVARGNDQFDGFRENVTEAVDGQANETSDRGTSLSLGGNATVTVTEQHATLLVGPDGVARHLEYYVNGTVDDRETSLTIELSVTDIDSTTVRQPEWTDKRSEPQTEQGG